LAALKTTEGCATLKVAAASKNVMQLWQRTLSPKKFSKVSKVEKSFEISKSISAWRWRSRKQFDAVIAARVAPKNQKPKTKTKINDASATDLIFTQPPKRLCQRKIIFHILWRPKFRQPEVVQPLRLLVANVWISAEAKTKNHKARSIDG
jgi:hypothetical protein